ncbi:36.4 kDa proline-rich protein-like [Iris pallida]|uniref:36.4 kDa proline-rich protein-like n=1 Tax=Iris pallida TaxID=29817 RepID=A0AAX6IAE3_IRIPA|nr:36.4 kDa proline-rich protein-like [Iris pallida]KAJ6849396.1 36.4 kDa proline-rich protein-like [Iris pallida]
MMRSHTTLLPILLILSLSSLLPSSLACPTCPTPKTPPPPPKAKPCPPPPKVKPPPTPPSPPKPPPKAPTPPKAPPPSSGCPIDILKLDACVDVLGGLLHALLGGGEADKECCPVISGLADLDAALCLCTSIKVKLLNIDILLPIALQVLVDCGKHAPSDFKCPA